MKRPALKNQWYACAVLVVVGCGIGALLVEAATLNYQHTITQLSQALTAYRSLQQRILPYDAVFRRDPMQALVNEQGELVTSSGLRGGLWVQGIIWSADHPMAVIDDELVASGASVGPYTILEIHADGVIAQRGREVVFIPLDRGLEPPTSVPSSESLSLLSLPEDVSPPFAPRRANVVRQGSALSLTLTASE